MNAHASAVELTRRVSFAPRIPPHIEAAAKHATIAPASALISKVPPSAREAKPKSAVMSMINRDVADAFFIG